ncbi:hypothetical protein JCM10512_2351 [Bacteroides reticulotermitis JCM 10512]|uniref:Uncharacterized protein n=1 Tax=Bacteroides reticulotermitis JCM 10512 TaxID=1445607 RepID=W4UTV3_9BACE|nr:hypothetical protein JCM10512_2351 [Bacteroides reticulotermitis JCM 10512]
MFLYKFIIAVIKVEVKVFDLLLKVTDIIYILRIHKAQVCLTWAVRYIIAKTACKYKEYK